MTRNYLDINDYEKEILKVREEGKQKYENDSEISKQIKSVEKALNGDGRVLIRPSGTESLIRVMIEGINQDEINEMAKSIADIIEEKYGLKN